jgi:hypothetical protein
VFTSGLCKHPGMLISYSLVCIFFPDFHDVLEDESIEYAQFLVESLAMLIDYVVFN